MFEFPKIDINLVSILDFFGLYGFINWYFPLRGGHRFFSEFRGGAQYFSPVFLGSIPGFFPGV